MSVSHDDIKMNKAVTGLEVSSVTAHEVNNSNSIIPVSDISFT